MPTKTLMAVCFGTILVTLPCVSGQDARSSVQETVDEVLSQYRQGAMKEANAHARLKELPHEAVVLSLVTALNREPTLKEGAHNFSYRMLRDLRAAHTEAGFQQFLFGLWMPAVAPICAEGLLDAPEPKQPDVLAHISRYLDETKTPIRPEKSKEGFPIPPSRSEIDLKGVLSAINRKGKDALPYVNILDTILRDRERAVDVRSAAAIAITKIKPLPEAIKHFDNLDESGLEASLTAWPQPVAHLISDLRKAGKSLREEDPLFFQKLRQFIVDGLNSSRPETQKAALEPMFLVFGNDMLVIRSREDYELNPELRPILEDISANHPDPGFRQRVQQLLSPQSLDKVVEGLYRERQRQEKSNNDNSDSP